MHKTLYSRSYQAFLCLLVKSRLEARLTQTEMALKMEEDQSWVSKVERGVRRLDVVELEHWCRAIDMPMSEFVRQYEELTQLGPGE